MTQFTRRNMLATMAMGGASLLAGGAEEGLLRAEAADTAQAAQPQLSPAERKQAAEKLVAYIAANGPLLLRPAEGILAHPWVSGALPKKEYADSLWDWDTPWTCRALFRLASMLGDAELRRKVGLHAQGSLLNFLDHQSEEGRIPIVMLLDKPDPFGCLRKSPPNHQNQAKPVMAQLALLVADETKDVEWLALHFDQLLRFHDSWVLGNESAIGLLVWGDDVAIGNDNDPTTFGRPFFSSANLLLNCLYYQDLRAAATLAQRLNRPRDEERLTDRAGKLGEQIQKYCWDPRDRFYYTVDVQCVDRRKELIGEAGGMAMSWQCLPLRIQSFTGFLPLWCGLATQQQARDLVQANYLADTRFRADWGVRSLSNLETMYSLVFSSNPSDWLGPVWIIANYFVWKALKNYGFDEEAASLANKIIRLLDSSLATTGSLNEYYHPDTGAPLSHQGFMDWNLLVLEMI